MPKYNALHLNLIEALGRSLPTFAPARSHSKDKGYGYIVRMRNRLTRPDEDGMDVLTKMQFSPKKLYHGNGTRMSHPTFDTPETTDIPDIAKECGISVREILGDKRLMRQQPVLHAVLRYADAFFRLALTDHPENEGYLSDRTMDMAQTIAEAFDKIPTTAEMAQLSVTNPAAYQAGMKMINYLNAYADFNDPELLAPAEKADTPEAQEKYRERVRRFGLLQNAWEDLNQVPYKDIGAFFDETGNEKSHAQVNSVFGEQKKRERCSTQLAGIKRLVDQGLTIQEARFISDFHSGMKDMNGELGGLTSLERIVEPIQSKFRRAVELSKICQEKLTQGVITEEEKNQLIKDIGTASEELSAAFQNTVLEKSKAKSEEERGIIADSTTLRETCCFEYTLPGGLFNRASEMKNRVIGLENAQKWANRMEMAPAYQILKATGTSYLGESGSQQSKDYKAMMNAFKHLTRQAKKFRLSPVEKQGVMENSLVAAEKGKAYLDSVFAANPAQMDRKQLGATRQRVVGALAAMHALNPERADGYLEKTAALFGQPLTWDGIRTMTRQAADRKPNYSKYVRLHCGNAVEALPDAKLAEYAAKVTTGTMYLDDPQKKFDVNATRESANRLMNSPDFKAAIKAAGPAKVREALQSGDPFKVALLTAGTSQRYQLEADSRRQLQKLAAGMETDGRSDQWVALKTALSSKKADSRAVFQAVEDYVKGKKSVTNDPQRKASVKLALDALAIAAKDGDTVAKARAKILVDRFNEVRHAEAGDRNFVDLKNYGKPRQMIVEPDAQSERSSILY